MNEPSDAIVGTIPIAQRYLKNPDSAQMPPGLANTPEKTIGQTLGLDNQGKSPRRFKRWIVWAVLLILALAIVVSVWSGSGTNGAVQYTTDALIRGDLTVTVTATGNLAPTNQVEVSSELSGIIKTVLVDFNDTVKVGQPLAYLDNTKFEAAMMQSRAGLASARATYRQAQATLRLKEQNLKRLRTAHDLSGGRAPSAGELEVAEAELLRAKADEAANQAAIDKARAALKIDETNLTKTTLFSPINGIVLQRSVDPGQTVASSLQAPVLFVLAEDLAQMELQVDVDEADVGLVHKGQSATFAVDAYPDRTFNAHITQVRFGSQITNSVVTYTTLLNVDNSDLLLRPGMTATAEITVQKIEDALLAPNTALRFAPPQTEDRTTGRRSGVFGMLFPRPRSGQHAKQPNGAAKKTRLWTLEENQPVPVVAATGATNGAMTIVTGDDLHAGMQVVVDMVAKK